MSSPFLGQANVFAANTGEKNAREQLIDFAERHGWLLDLTALRSHYAYARHSDKEFEQDPNRFIRTAHPDLGGHWCVELDYEVVGDPDEYRPRREWDNTLRAVRIWHSSAVDERGVVTGCQELRNYHQSNSARSRLWDLTDSEDGKFRPLRKRAEMLLADPDPWMWAVVADYFTDAEKDRRRREERAAQQALRRKPLPIRIPKDQFRQMAEKLRRIGGDIANADGLTDLHDEVAKAHALVLGLQAALVEIEDNCFYCETTLAPEERSIDPNNHRTYGPCCREHALRFEKKGSHVSE